MKDIIYSLIGTLIGNLIALYLARRDQRRRTLQVIESAINESSIRKDSRK